MHAVTLITTLLFCFLGRTNGQPPSTVVSLDGPAYLGRWYQMYVSLIPNITFEKNGFCCTAEYTALSPVSFNVTNSQNIGGPKGPLVQFKGVAVNVGAPGKWAVSFFGTPGPYWIIATSQIVTGRYQWALVSSPNKQDLYVLARDTVAFYKFYNKAILAYLTRIGYTLPSNKPLQTFQGSECNYAWK